MRVYIAGPMSGIPGFNFPAFDLLAEQLRESGFDVVSPAELDDPEHADLARASVNGDPAEIDAKAGKTWGDFLARDVKLIADSGIEGIVLLPGWEQSRGAKLETFVGALMGLPIMEGRSLVMIHPTRLLAAWGRSLMKNGFREPKGSDCGCV